MIKSSATADDQTSPFYTDNERFCESVEKFIAENNGASNGVFSVYAYSIIGIVEKAFKWHLKYRKASLNGGSIGTSSKDQLSIVVAEWTCYSPALKGKQFRIEPKSFWSSFKMVFINSISKLKSHEGYIVQSSEPKSQTLVDLIVILKPLLVTGELLSITHDKNELKIMVRTEKHHFDLLSTLFNTIKGKK